MDIFKRAGSLAAIDLLFPLQVYLYRMLIPQLKDFFGYAKIAPVDYNVKKGDVILIVNCNGMNSVTIESAIESKKMDLKVIAITSGEFSIYQWEKKIKCFQQ